VTYNNHPFGNAVARFQSCPLFQKLVTILISIGTTWIPEQYLRCQALQLHGLTLVPLRSSSTFRLEVWFIDRHWCYVVGGFRRYRGVNRFCVLGPDNGQRLIHTRGGQPQVCGPWGFDFHALGLRDLFLGLHGCVGRRRLTLWNRRISNCLDGHIDLRVLDFVSLEERPSRYTFYDLCSSFPRLVSLVGNESAGWRSSGKDGRGFPRSNGFRTHEDLDARIGRVILQDVRHQTETPQSHQLPQR